MSILSTFAPQTALRREIARQRYNMLVDVAKAQGYGDHGASHTKKALKGFGPRPGSPDEDIVQNLDTLRARSRSLFMGYPLANGALKTINTSVVGSGLRLNAQIDNNFLGITRDQAQEWEENTEREFALWANTTSCDASRRFTFGQLTRLAQMSAALSGDCFALLPITPRNGEIYDLRIRLIEADRVANPQTIANPETDIFGGVELSESGELAAYWIASHYPRSMFRPNGKGTIKYERVPAFGANSGRRNVLHIMDDLERIDQRRGVPRLAPVIELVKQLGSYTNSEVMGALIGSMLVAAVTSDLPEILPSTYGDDNRVDDDIKVTEMGPGTIVHLQPGQDLKNIIPARPNTGFDGFVQALCRQLGASLGIGAELLNKHFTASYSASRAALLEAWKVFRSMREYLVESFVQPVYEEWLTEAIIKGRIQAPGFFADPAIRAAWCGAEWCGPTMGQLNPVQEVTAAKMRVEEEFSTREREASELTGSNWDMIHRTRTREESRRREDGTYLSRDYPVITPEKEEE
jgi:lambda family phage portal protein